MASKRILKEMKDLKNHYNSIYKIIPDEDNIFIWKSQIKGPDKTPYEEGEFILNITFPPDYPFTAPKIRFETPIYHCNINERGFICLDILKDEWSPILTIEKILLSICSLLNDPNPNDPLRPDIADEYKNDNKLFIENAIKHTKNYAINKNGKQ